jgi:predicted AAA+ superfamily ATPase
MHWRWIDDDLKASLRTPYVHILFGARQTGKSTLLRRLIPEPDIWLDLADPEERLRLSAHPSEFTAQCRGLARRSAPSVVVVDEAQHVPAIFDAVQSLYDEDKTRWRFVLSGSSARKLRAAGANLLPGRSILFRLFPLTAIERPFHPRRNRANRGNDLRVLNLPYRRGPRPDSFPPVGLEARLAYGELPGIAVAQENVKARLLQSYATVYLEEEIRREGLVKDLGTFARFLSLAAQESGGIVNYAAISREAGVSLPTVKSYYQLLEDMFVGFRIDAFSQSPRKHLLSTPKFCLFDAGVRHAAGGIQPGLDVVKAAPGSLFEQWVGQELWKRLHYLGRGRLFHYRTRGGAEVDYVVELDGKFTPIEVKWAEHPGHGDATHVLRFMSDYPRKTAAGYVVCRCKEPMELAANVMAIPYDMM